MPRVDGRVLARSLVFLSAVAVQLAGASGATGAVRRHIATTAPCAGLECPQALQRVDDCSAFRGYLVDAFTEELLRAWAGYGWYRGGPAGGGADGGDKSLDFTTTNNQEEGVDELDIVKSDGYHLYLTDNQDLHIVRSWPPTDTTLLATVQISPWSTHGLFLRRDLVAVLSYGYRTGGEVPGFRSSTATTITLVDVRDRAKPRVIRSIDVSGYLAGARMIDGQLYMVLQDWIWVPAEAWELLWKRNKEIGLPEYDRNASQAERDRLTAIARQVLRPHIDKIVAALDIDVLLPHVWDADVAAGTKSDRPLLSCAELLRPRETSSLGFLTVANLDLDAVASGRGEVRGTGLLANGWTIYASSRNLYVANSLPWWWWFGDVPKGTAIHAFALGSSSSAPVRYSATGLVPGYLLDQFSMGEHNGYLRVASSQINWWAANPQDRLGGSAVTVLHDDGASALQPVGSVSGIAPGERIFASRFMGDRGYLITFEQIDPLFTLDLSRPTSPKVVGQIEIPGVSTYLHPAGDGYLLAVGRAPDAQGHLSSVAVNLFDVRDAGNPKLAATYSIGAGEESWTWSDSQWDHHAFTFHRGVLSVPVQWWKRDWQPYSGLVVLSVDTAKGIKELGRVDHGDLGNSRWMPWMRRSVYVEDYLYSVSTLGVKTSELYRPASVLAAVKLDVPRS